MTNIFDALGDAFNFDLQVASQHEGPVGDTDDMNYGPLFGDPTDLRPWKW